MTTATDLKRRAAHCWADYHDQWGDGSAEYWEHQSDPPATCWLPDGHEGPHEYTPDSTAGVQFNRSKP